LKIDPAAFQAHSNHARILLGLKRHEEALQACEKALSLNRSDVNALIFRGAALLLLKKPDKALESFDKALAIKPDFFRAFYNRGEALLELMRFENALAAYDRAPPRI